MFQDGSFPLEMRRTKPYGYALFQLDQLATVAQILVDAGRQPLDVHAGRRPLTEEGVDFMYPFIADKSRWTLPTDVMYFEYWPVRHASLVFAGLAYREAKYIELWKKLPADPVMTEIQRNTPVRYPSLWVALTGHGTRDRGWREGTGDRGARGDRARPGESRAPSPEPRSRGHFAIVTVQVPCCTASRGVRTMRFR